MIGCIDCSIFTLDVNYLCFPKDIPKNIQQIDVEDVRDSTISKANSIHTRIIETRDLRIQIIFRSDICPSLFYLHHY